MLDKTINIIKQLTDAGVALIALAVVVQIIFAESNIPFIGGDVIGTITDIVTVLGSAGLVGLAAVAVLYVIFSRD